MEETMTVVMDDGGDDYDGGDDDGGDCGAMGGGAGCGALQAADDDSPGEKIYFQSQYGFFLLMDTNFKRNSQWNLLNMQT